MRTDQFDFALPETLIADTPASPRDNARLLVVGESLQDKTIRDLPSFLQRGDVMVFNDTRVIPARLFGKRGEVKVEILLHKNVTPLGINHYTLWQCFAKPAKRLKVADRIVFADDFSATVHARLESGEVCLRFDDDPAGIYRLLECHGHMPLPPYIRRADVPGDRDTYQTVYAKHEGSVAAPTAGLHFTDKLLAAIDAIGVKRVHVTLHVGGGTFLPVKVEDTKDHVMHSEYAVVTQEAADAINRAKASGGRVVAVGTTSLRTLESATGEDGVLKPMAAYTSIFITPGYRFRLVNVLMTNFHLPRSTLFMLVSAFSGLDHMRQAYQHAIEKSYRFYSYGDACLLFPSTAA